MRCGHCGEPLPPDALFCGECGRAVQAGPTTPRTPRVSMVKPIMPPPPSGPPIPLPPPPPPPAAQTVIIAPLVGEPAVAEPAVAEPAVVEPAEYFEPVETSGTGAASPIPEPVVEPAVEPAPESAPEPAPVSDDEDDVDDDPTTVSPRRVPPAVSATIVASTGQRFQIGGRVLLGRRPAPADGEEYDAVLVIVDEGKTVSKTHLELSVDRERISVTDLGSGNGTVIETPGEQPVRCVAGVPHPVPRGSRLVLGRQFLMIA